MQDAESLAFVLEDINSTFSIFRRIALAISRPEWPEVFRGHHACIGYPTADDQSLILAHLSCPTHAAASRSPSARISMSHDRVTRNRRRRTHPQRIAGARN